MKALRSLRWTGSPCLAASLVLVLVFVIVLLGHASQAGKEHNEADQELNAIYQKALSLMTDAEDRRLFVEAQRAWIKHRDAEVAFHARYFPESKGGLFVSIDMIKARTEALKVLLTDDARREHQAPSDDAPKK